MFYLCEAKQSSRMNDLDECTWMSNLEALEVGIHTFLKDFPDLESFSRGKEPHRQLVIRTIGSS